MRKFVLLMKRSSVLALKKRQEGEVSPSLQPYGLSLPPLRGWNPRNAPAGYGILLLKGGRLPPGSIRVWGGAKYRKFGPGDWRLEPVTDRMKRPASLKDHIHTILHGTDEEKVTLRQSFFCLSDTPPFMKELGINGNYFTARYGVIARHEGKDADHNLTEQDWINLCEKIKDPFAIAKHGDGYRLFTDVKVNNHNVIVGIRVKSMGKNVMVNSISTVFGYRNRPITDEIIYIAQKITPGQKALLKRPNSPPYLSSQGPMR